MAGRPKKPTNLKLLKGTLRTDRINKDEPKPKINIPKAPTHLNKEAKKEWKEMAQQLFNLGLLTNIDKAALAGYCQLYGRWVQAEKKLGAGELVIETKSGNLIQNPYLGIANRAYEIMFRSLTDFGMTPASRARVSVASKKKVDDPWSEFEPAKNAK